MTTNKKIGIVNVISVGEMSVITYALDSYALAKLQAEELLKGVTAQVDRLPEIVTQNGLKQTGYRLPTLEELVIIQELEVGTSVLPVE